MVGYGCSGIRETTFCTALEKGDAFPTVIRRRLLKRKMDKGRSDREFVQINFQKIRWDRMEGSIDSIKIVKVNFIVLGYIGLATALSVAA